MKRGTIKKIGFRRWEAWYTDTDAVHLTSRDNALIFLAAYGVKEFR